ncbi:CGNR zinc finger domain-containing protein [Sinomicrobium weinanense]|uniref:CGNR zinc finger domain-containing protein n=1 Tax=Sinomicrobium weinanense TaxID=2842200 RepID=A0A926JTG8_9FLAO|nr:ABATE domain-containing protein [Sinomicrobium weinanense]MBC9797195.1 CGNR zinc finger domain-containing protein [Sinomicrobium weinanense]MBU3122741.1 CGNR zinc finger domain-containing protein [Sinomicrobium weinanense]
MVKKYSINNIRLDGGTLCLDFVNTVHDRKKEPLPDYLLHTDDLVAWGIRLELLPENTLTLAATQKGKDPLKEAIIFRELLYRIFFALGKDGSIVPEDLKTFNHYLSHYLPYLRITKENNGFDRTWELPAEEVSRIIAPVLLDAYDLILSDKLHRVKECPNCGWLFFDATKNGRRRWCSMKSCGSSVKALEWYHRQKKKG